jgi:methylmalonyl-CoA mutase
MKLFSEFQPVSAKEWEEKILKDLKITSIQELFWHTPEGLDIRPFYNQEHIQNLTITPTYHHQNWEITQFIPTENHSAAELNEHLIKSLNGGATGIALNFFHPIHYSEVFNNISLPHIYSNIHISFDTFDILEKYKDIYLSNNEFTQQKNCFINIDPIFLYTYFGEWHLFQEKDFEILHHLNHIPVNASLYKESGCNVIQELAYTLAHLNEYLFYLDTKNQLSKYKDIHLQLSIGYSFFTEIAKFKSLRILVHHLLKEYNHTANVHIHAQTTLLNKSYLDIYNNIIRTTTESMSAIFGGANSISILPFDYPFNKISDFSLRMARNQLIIMREESYLNKTAETTLGSFYIENYTQALVEKAYHQFLEIEKQQGLIPLLENGVIQQDIQNSFEKQLKEYIDNKKILIGINKYPSPNQEKKNQFYYSLQHSSTPNALKYKRLAEYFENQI